LNRLAVGLDLPTAIVGAVVLNGELDVHTKMVLGLGSRVSS
jgi:hypothetical protein